MLVNVNVVTCEFVCGNRTRLPAKLILGPTGYRTHQRWFKLTCNAWSAHYATGLKPKGWALLERLTNKR